jgi:hypothetical protein
MNIAFAMCFLKIRNSVSYMNSVNYVQGSY